MSSSVLVQVLAVFALLLVTTGAQDVVGGKLVALEDVTTPRTSPASHKLVVAEQGTSELGYPDPARPSRPGQGGGFVNLEDVTGQVQAPQAPLPPLFPQHPHPPLHHPRPPRPHHPQHPGQYPQYPQYSPCTPSYLPQQSLLPPHATSTGKLVSLSDVVPAGAQPSGGVDGVLSRARRALVSLNDVAGPVAAHYPVVGPPAYVRPSYTYNHWHYNNRPRPYYYNSYYYTPLPCIGVGAAPGANSDTAWWVPRRPVVSVSELGGQGGDREPQHHQHPGPSDKLVDSVDAAEDAVVDGEAADDYVPREFIRRRR